MGFGEVEKLTDTVGTALSRSGGTVQVTHVFSATDIFAVGYRHRRLRATRYPSLGAAA